MDVLAIAGSLRPDSYNRLLVDAAATLAPAGVRLQPYQGLEAIPPFGGERHVPEAPPAVADLRSRIEHAGGVLIATPEYNGSIPGVLKNALDWASTPFPENALRGKPVVVIGASTSAYGGIWAQAELRKVLGITGARVIDAELAVPHAHLAFADGVLLDSEHRDRLAAALAALAAERQPLAA
jgi:chromate reductase